MNRLLLTCLTGASIVSSSFASDLAKRVKADFSDYGSRPFVHYAVPAMSEVQRLADSYPTDGAANGTVKIFAAKGEYEPGSFNVWGVKDLGKVRFELSEFKQVEKVGGGGERETGVVFPAKNLDLKLVKCWYQNLNGWFSYFGDNGDWKLVPELLLNDEDLIRTDTKAKANYARIVGADGKKREQWINGPKDMDVVNSPLTGKTGSIFQPMAPGFDDAAELKPVALPKEQFRNFFLTAHVTKDIPAGVYKGEILLTRGHETGDKRRENSNIPNSNIQTLGSIPVEIHVASYELPQPKCYKEPTRDFLVWFYHYNALGYLMSFNGGDRALALKQLDPMLRDMVAHGQNMHPCWFNMGPEELYTVERCIQAGMRPDAFVGGPCFYSDDRTKRLAEIKRVADEYDRRFGCHNIYSIYGDEPGLGKGFFYPLADRIEDWHSFGMKHFIAGEECVFRKMGYGTDWFNMAEDPARDNRQLRLWNGVPGKRVAWYARQHVGAENPALNRRQNGLGAWLSGYTCFANYAHHLGPYNDASEYYKPMVYAYGAHSGMIDTIQWEGFREGIDDMRYATLATDLARKAMAGKDTKAALLGAKVFQYLALVERETADLDTVRAELRHYIDQLLAYVKPDPVVPVKRLAPKPEAAEAALAAELKPLEEELAKAKKDLRGPVFARIKKVYEKYYRWEALADRCEKEGDLLSAADYAHKTFQTERAEVLRLKAMRDTKLPVRDRARTAWSLVLGHPEFWQDKEALELLSTVVERKTNNYVSVWNTYGLLHDATSHAERYRTSWKNAYRLVAKVADSAGIKGMGAPAARYAIEIFAAEGDRKAVNEVAARFLSNPKLKPADRYTFGLYAKLFGAEIKKPFLFGSREKSIGAVVEDYEKENLTKDITTAQRMAAINNAGQIANALCDAEMMRGLEAYRTSLYKQQERRRYTVKFSEKPVEGTDWTGIGAETALCDRAYGGSTELMDTDVTTGNRNISKSSDKKEPMKLQIAADTWGIHFRFESTDEKAMAVASHLADGGTFEGYVAPGKNRPYACFLKDDNDGAFHVWNTVYEAAGQSPVNDKDPNRFRSYTSFAEGKIVSVLSISWQNYVNDLPQDGSVWDFEVFRWGRDDCAWNGSRCIHERSTWGELVFDLSKDERLKIVRLAAENASWRFRREASKTMRIDRYEGCVRHWDDRNVGDEAFYAEVVKPWADNLLETGKLLGEEPSDATIQRLEDNGTIRTWNDVFFEMDRKRYDWLTK